MTIDFTPKNHRTIALKKKTIGTGIFEPVIVSNSTVYGHTCSLWAKYLKIGRLSVAIDNTYELKTVAVKSIFPNCNYIKKTSVESKLRPVSDKYFKIDNEKKFYMFYNQMGFEFQLKEILNGVHIYILINEINMPDHFFVLHDGTHVAPDDFIPGKKPLTLDEKRKQYEVATGGY